VKESSSSSNNLAAEGLIASPASPKEQDALIELVTRLQNRQHKHGLMFQPAHSKHVGDVTVPNMGIPTCPHPECVMVRSWAERWRAEVSSPARPPTQRGRRHTPEVGKVIIAVYEDGSWRERSASGEERTYSFPEPIASSPARPQLDLEPLKKLVADCHRIGMSRGGVPWNKVGPLRERRR